MRAVVTVALIALASPSAAAFETDLAILPASGISAGDSALLQKVLVEAATQQSLRLAPASDVDALIASGCGPVDDVCAREIGDLTKSERLLVPQVQAIDGRVLLRLSVYRVADGSFVAAEPVEAESFAPLLRGAESRVRPLLRGGPLPTGTLALAIAGGPAHVFVNGIPRPEASLTLPSGPHYLRVVAGEQVYTKNIEIALNETTQMSLCVSEVGVVEGGCLEPPSTPVLTIAGGVTTTVGVLALGLGGAFALVSAHNVETVANGRGTLVDDVAESAGPVDDALAYANASTWTLVGGALVTTVGAAMLTAGLILEDAP